MEKLPHRHAQRLISLVIIDTPPTHPLVGNAYPDGFWSLNSHIIKNAVLVLKLPMLGGDRHIHTLCMLSTDVRVLSSVTPSYTRDVVFKQKHPSELPPQKGCWICTIGAACVTSFLEVLPQQSLIPPILPLALLPNPREQTL